MTEDFVVGRLRAALEKHDVIITPMARTAWDLAPITGAERKSGWANVIPSPVLSEEGLESFELRLCPAVLADKMGELPLGTPGAEAIYPTTVDGRARLIAHVVMQQLLSLEHGASDVEAFSLLTLQHLGVTPALVYR
jgi:hypothetical protein